MFFIYIVDFFGFRWIVGIKESYNYVNNLNVCMLFFFIDV